MAIQASKPNSRVFLLLGVLLAALAFGGVLFALRQSGGGGNNVNLVVTKGPITAGTQLTTDMITTSAVPASVAPADAFTDPSTVVGKTTTVAVAQNTPLVPAFFSAPPLSAATTTTSASGQPISVETQIVKGYVALAIPATPVTPPTSSGQSGVSMNTFGLVGDQASAGYYIQPGDHIDILIDPGNGGVRFSFQDVPVLRVGDLGSTGTPSVFIVEVPRSQAELLTALTTNRGLVKDNNGSVVAGPFVVKYVLRPESEWGKMAADDSSYKPNYEATTGPALPSPADGEVTVGSLNALFGH